MRDVYTKIDQVKNKINDIKDEKYADAFVNQLLGWIESVPHIPENDKAWRTLETGLRMEYWIKAMMYFSRRQRL